MKYNSSSSELGYIPISLSPILSSESEIHPLESKSKILKASKRLKSCLYIKAILAFSSSLSREIYSLKDLTSSSSSSRRRGVYFLKGELDLCSSYDYLKPPKCDSLKGEESLKGVAVLIYLL